MNKTEREVFDSFLKKIYNLNDEEIAGLYNEAGELDKTDLILTKDSERVSKFKKEKGDEFKNGEKKAMIRIEKHLKEKYNVESDLLGEELIDHVFDAKTSELTEKLSKKFNADDIEKHPAFIQKRTEFEKQLKAKDTEWEGKITAKEAEWNQKQSRAQVSKLALTHVETNYLMPENATRANALKDVLIREFDSNNYDLPDNSDPIILDKDGKPLEDEHGRMISFKDYTDRIASKYFDKKVANQRGNAGNQQQQQQGQPITVKDQSEFKEKMANAKTSEERAAIMKAGKEAGLLNS